MTLKAASSAKPKASLKKQPQTPRPHARTTPPTSLFLPMQLSNSTAPDRRGQRPAHPMPSASDIGSGASRPQSPARARIPHRLAHAKQERPRHLRPRLSAGRSAIEKFPKPAAPSASEVRRAIGEKRI